MLYNKVLTVREDSAGPFLAGYFHLMNAGKLAGRINNYSPRDWRTGKLGTMVVISGQSVETSDPIDRLSAGYMDRHIAHYCRRSSVKEVYICRQAYNKLQPKTAEDWSLIVHLTIPPASIIAREFFSATIPTMRTVLAKKRQRLLTRQLLKQIPVQMILGIDG